MAKRAYIKHISSFYPENVADNPQDERLTKTLGVYHRHIANDKECASDLAIRAAAKLFNQYNINRSKIDALILCTQTPDYILPASSCIIHGKLGLSNRCMVFDYNQGGAGYIYGLSLAKGLIESSQAENVLLLTADTISKLIHPKDMRVKPIFGDGAAATLLTGTSSRIEFLRNFKFYTSGADFKKIIVYYGGMKMKNTPSDVAFQEITDNYGNIHTDANIYMDGRAFLRFALDIIPTILDETLKESRLSIDDIDNFILHQASKFMLDNIQKSCGLQNNSKFYNNCQDIGNTSVASIPNIINQMQQENIILGSRALLMGFGIGLSLGSCIADLTMIDRD